MTIDFRAAQRRLGVAVDGNFGPVSYGALLTAVANRVVPLAIELGRAIAASDEPYGLTQSPDRLASFIGQCCHESGGFRHMEELGGPSYFWRMYDIEGKRPAKARELGNTRPGDGARYHGRGLIQLTGRANYRRYGIALGCDFIVQPELVATPLYAVLTAMEFWKRNGLNVYADEQDWTGQTKRINGGVNGLKERVALIQMAKGLLE